MITNYQQDQEDQILKKELLQARMMLLHRINQYDKFEDKFSHQDGVQYMEILRLKLQHCLIETQYLVHWENLSKSSEELTRERQDREREAQKLKAESARKEQQREHSNERRQVQLIENVRDKNNQNVMKIQMSQQDYDEYMKFKHTRR